MSDQYEEMHKSHAERKQTEAANMARSSNADIEARNKDIQGYINIYYMDNEYHLELHVGVQSFKLDYSNEDYEAVRWMATQFAHALNRIVGDVRLYGTEPARLDNPDEGHDEDETQNKQGENKQYDNTK